MSPIRIVRLAAVAAAGLIVAAPLLAAAPDDRSTVALRHVNLSPQDARQANRLLGRLSTAAMEACGASSSSVPQHRQAVRGSACWRTSMTDVITRIGNPQLTAAFERHPAQIAQGSGEPVSAN